MMIMIKWINKRQDMSDVIKKLDKIEKRLEGCEKELQLLRIALNLR